MAAGDDSSSHIVRLMSFQLNHRESGRHMQKSESPKGLGPHQNEAAGGIRVRPYVVNPRGEPTQSDGPTAEIVAVDLSIVVELRLVLPHLNWI